MPDHGHHGGMRLPDLTPADLTTRSGRCTTTSSADPVAADRSTSRSPHSDGALTGPFGVMVHEPGPRRTAAGARQCDPLRHRALRAAARDRDPRGGHRDGSAFEQYAHERVGRAVGLTDDELAALAAGTFASTDAVEESAYALCRRLLADRSRLTDEEYADVVAVLGTTTVTELVVLVGYYRTLAQLLDVFDVGVPD